MWLLLILITVTVVDEVSTTDAAMRVVLENSDSTEHCQLPLGSGEPDHHSTVKCIAACNTGLVAASKATSSANHTGGEPCPSWLLQFSNVGLLII